MPKGDRRRIRPSVGPATRSSTHVYAPERGSACGGCDEIPGEGGRERDIGLTGATATRETGTWRRTPIELMASGRQVARENRRVRDSREEREPAPRRAAPIRLPRRIFRRVVGAPAEDQEVDLDTEPRGARPPDGRRWRVAVSGSWGAHAGAARRGRVLRSGAAGNRTQRRGAEHTRHVLRACPNRFEFCSSWPRVADPGFPRDE